MSNKKCKEIVELLASENLQIELNKKNINVEEITFDIKPEKVISYIFNEMKNKKMTVRQLFLFSRNESECLNYHASLYSDSLLENVSNEAIEKVFSELKWSTKDKLNIINVVMSLVIESLENGSYFCIEDSLLMNNAEEYIFDIYIEESQTNNLELKKGIIDSYNELLNKEIKTNSIDFILKLYRQFGVEKIKGFEKEVWDSLHSDYKYIIANIVDILTTKNSCEESFQEIEVLRKKLTSSDLLHGSNGTKSLNEMISENKYTLLSVYFYLQNEIDMNDYKIKIKDCYESLAYIIKELLFLESNDSEALSLIYPIFSEEILGKLLDLKNKNQELFNEKLLSVENFNYISPKISKEIDVLPVLYLVNSKSYLKTIKKLSKENILDDFIFRDVKGKVKKSDLMKIKEINPQDLTEETKEYLKNKNISLYTVVDYINKDFKYKIKDFNESEDIYFKIEKEEIDLIELKFAN